MKMKQLFLILLISLLKLNLTQAALFTEKLNLSHYQNNSFFYYTLNTSQNGLLLENPSFSSTTNLKKVEPPLSHLITLNCDKNIQVERLTHKKRINSKHTFPLYGKNNSSRIILRIPEQTHCLLIEKDPILKKEKRIQISPYAEQFPVLQSMIYGGIEKTFSESTLLPNPQDAFNKRVEILLGKKLDISDLNRRDPLMFLNLTSLPKFDLIYLSTLQINSDFVCHIIFRLLAAHAQKGTPVVLTLSKILLGEKEEALLEWLEKQSPNIKIIRYQFKEKSNSNWTDRLHRVYHGKVFMTYSADYFELNNFIGGGRNMSDRYFFENKVAFSDKSLTQYDEEKMNPWAYFFDLDFHIQSKQLVENSLQTLLNFSQLAKYESVTEEDQTGLFHSIPFIDDGLLEKKFIKVIDEAKQSIEILTPYIYFTPEILRAFKSAVTRGVTVRFIVSSSLFGDAMTKKLKKVYDNYAYRTQKLIEIYSYPMTPGSIMHRKGLLADDHNLVLGSVNFSQRSFVHDAETAFFTSDPSLIEQYKQVFEQMKNQSTLIDNMEESGKMSVELLQIFGLESVI